MPVGFSSPVRNLFLLGSSGAQVVTNFFKTIDQSAGTDGVYLPDEIKYNFADQKFVLAGSASDTNSKGFGWFEKRDNAGTADWDVRVEAGVGVNTTLRAMELDSNDNLIVVGKTADIPWIAKYSNGGVIDWQATTNSADVEYTGITSDSNGQYYACGNTPTSGEAQAFVEKFDTSGNPGWGKSAFMLGRDVVLNRIAANARGEVVAVGYLEDDVYNKGYIVKIDTNTGEVLWDRTLSPDWQGDMLNCSDVYIDSNDQIYVTVNGTFVGYLIKYTAEGNMIWQKTTDNPSTTITFDQVKSDGATEQTIVFGTYDNGTDVGGVLSKYSKDGSLVWRRTLYSSFNNTDTFSNVCLDADPSFYYLMYVDDAIDGLNGTPDAYTFGKVSSSGNGLGAFQYFEGTGQTIDYEILNVQDKIGKLSDGSVRQDTSDLITYPFNANKILFDDLATQVSNKKRQMDSADSFEYSGSPAIRPADFQELNLLGDAGVVNTGLGRILLVDSRGDGVYSGVMRNIAGNAKAWTNNSAAWTDLVAGGAWNFDDTIPSTMSFDIQSLLQTVDTTPFTLEVWALREDSNRWQTVVSIANSWVQIAFDSANIISCGRNGGGGGINARSGVVSEANRWYHIVMSYDGNQTGSSAYIDIYVDGVKTKSKTDMGVNSFGGNGVNLYLGRYAGGNGELLDGYVGEVRLYNRALNDVEVAQNYNASKERFTGEPQFGKVLTNDVDVSWGDQSKNGYKAYSNIYQPTYNATEGSWEFDGNGSTTFDQLNIDIEEFTPYGWEMWFENYNTIVANELAIGGPSTYQVLASWAYPAGITLGGWTSSALNEAIIFWSRNGGNGSNKGTYTRTQVPIGKHHLFVRWNGSTYDIFVDGVKQTVYHLDSGVNPAELVTYTGKCIHIGGNNASYFFHGKIFETRLYTREIPESVVFQNYNATKSKYINEAPDTAPKIGPGIVYDSNLLLNYDFGNRATYDRTNQNLVPYSQGDNWISNWTNVSATILSTTERSPVGTNDAVKYTGTGFALDVSMTSGNTYVWSLYVKVVDAAGDTIKVGHGASQYGSAGNFTANISYNLSDWSKNYSPSGDNAYIYDVVPVGDGWYRIGGKAYKGDANQGQFEIYIGNMNATVMVWGPQLEEWSGIGAFESNPPKASRYFGTTGTVVNNVPTTVKNLSSSSYTGTINGATFNSAGYFEFDGVDDRLSNFDVLLSQTNGWTCELWFKAPDPVNQNTPSTWNYLFRDAEPGGPFWECGMYGNGLTFSMKDNTIPSNQTAVEFNLTQNQWHYLAFGLTSTGETFLTGSDASGNLTTDLPGVAATSGACRVVNLFSNDTGGGLLPGHCGEIRLYDKELTLAERTQNFNATRSKYGV